MFAAKLARLYSVKQARNYFRVCDVARPYLSVVIPAYNEEHRLPSTLSTVITYLSERPYSSEVIVADDGSTDGTGTVADAFSDTSEKVRVLHLPHRGKASAVTAGVRAAQGDIIMFADADLSTPFEYAEALIAAVEQGAGVAIGSREGAGAQRHGEPGYRHLMGRVFNWVVRLIAVPGVSDTQCGFKAFRHDVARDVFSALRLYENNQEVRGPRVTGFDVEVLFVARQRGYELVEVPVEWTHVSGSKVAPLSDSVRMFVDVLRVRYNALRGRYSSNRGRSIRT